ncbi:MAG: ABC transporter ATP-binding protein [Pegethrix bostrychoides GSE-TBD4-15B]|jgi:iron(III) transport system ATP-binding protein|uniref:ABC-type quaternary amine transporter n=1 Tax=Pegethrix bostrychoides GSE-TBD4-15B TaxID=2839662 RepID=A0A951P9C6_9CYAN|nr:ABC transporter ATP-binding protein [Pegethrix bostrychoides GSE-TBD4-15B]
MPSPILQLNQVTRQFSRLAQPAVCAVSCSLQSGDLLALLGPSGCGKTTLLRLIAGFEQPQDGSIEIAERQVAGDGVWVPPEQRGVGMVFQDYALFPHLTVRQNVMFGLNDRLERGKLERSKLERSKRLKEVLALVRLEGLEDRFPHQLSGGQQQRVALARALAPSSALILLDEPLSNLDLQVRLRLRQELRQILKAAGASAIFVTHDQEEALSIADQVAVMCQGRLEQVGTPEQLYQRPASRFVAEFVTQANLIAAERRGEFWQTELGDIPVTQTESANCNQADLLVRQENLILSTDASSPIVIRDRQFLGREYCYSLELPSGQSLQARSPIGTHLAVGTFVQVAVAAPQLQLYPR